MDGVRYKNQHYASVGDVLKKTVIDGLGISVSELSRALHVPTNRIYHILQNKRDISIDTAIRLGLFLDMSPHFWLNIQAMFMIEEANEHNSSDYARIQSFNNRDN